MGVNEGNLIKSPSATVRRVQTPHRRLGPRVSCHPAIVPIQIPVPSFHQWNLGLSFDQARMRPVFVGNFEYETRQSELERLFSKYGRVERVDMKSGNCFPLSGSA
ncbi:hypothetical protein BT93_D1570 [Corymbia citriodora subsp. variegata]|nr:hypothetical protein BT93_D1570 [Corymbia citriodora subsp. variegata]